MFLEQTLFYKNCSGNVLTIFIEHQIVTWDVIIHYIHTWIHTEYTGENGEIITIKTAIYGKEIPVISGDNLI